MARPSMNSIGEDLDAAVAARIGISVQKYCEIKAVAQELSFQERADHVSAECFGMSLEDYRKHRAAGLGETVVQSSVNAIN